MNKPAEKNPLFYCFWRYHGEGRWKEERVWDGKRSTDRTCACSSNWELTMDLIVQSIL